MTDSWKAGIAGALTPILFCLVVAGVCTLLGCDQQAPAKAASKGQQQSYPPPTTAQEPPQSSPKQDSETPARDVPYYGSTIFEGEITSIYYYPNGPDADHPAAQTHVKFNHHEEEPETIWLCGDARKSLEVGNKYRMVLTYEPNAECITNWKVK